VWRYDYANDHWIGPIEVNGTKPVGVASHAAIYIPSRNSMMIVGGYTFSDTPTNQIALFSFDDDTWEILR
jgi:hypothetical protein